MANLNLVQLMGNLTRDPEIKQLPSGTVLAEFCIAVNRRWKAEGKNELKEETTFVDCTAFGRTAEVIEKHIKKGSPIYAQGRLKLDQWESTDGTKRQKLRVIVEKFEFLSGKKDEEGGSQPRQSNKTNGGGYRGEPAPDDAPPLSDEDIPF